MNMNAYETFHVQDHRTASLAVELVETAFPDIKHEWLPAEGRGAWICKHGLFYIIFKDEEYRGFFCIVKHGTESYLHFGTVGRSYAFADVLFGLDKALCVAANVYGIPELFCEIDESGIVGKMVEKLGFTQLSGGKYSIRYHHGQTKEAKET